MATITPILSQKMDVSWCTEYYLDASPCSFGALAADRIRVSKKSLCTVYHTAVWDSRQQHATQLISFILSCHYSEMIISLESKVWHCAEKFASSFANSFPRDLDALCYPELIVDNSVGSINIIMYFIFHIISRRPRVQYNTNFLVVHNYLYIFSQ